MKPPLGPSVPLVPPLYQSSVYTLPDLDALEAVYAGGPGFIYARDAHPNATLLATEIAKLEAAAWAVIGGSGMSVIAATTLAIVKPGDRILASNRLYGRTTQLLVQELGRFGVDTELIDANDLSAVRQALIRPARVLVVETISNPLLRVADIPALAEICKSSDCLLLVDNTFATPVLCRPLELGADLVVESLTKMIGGHGDITLGAVCGHNDLQLRLQQVVTIWGLMSNPFECWLACRGLPTLALRVDAASANAAALAVWLGRQRGVRTVLYPGLAAHPDHSVAAKILGIRFGHVLGFELEGGRDAVNAFMRNAPGIPFSPSLGDARTTCSYPAATSHRYVEAEERRRMGIGEGLIRLSVGVEPLEHIQMELARGLN